MVIAIIGLGQWEEKAIMFQRRKILISFLTITMLQGITYPAIALGSEPNAMQASSNNQTAVPVQNPNSTQRWFQCSRFRGQWRLAIFWFSVRINTTEKKFNPANRTGMTANPTLPNRTGITAALVPTNRLKQDNLKTVGSRIRSTTTKMALWPSARSVHSKFSDKPRRRNLDPFWWKR